MCCAAIWSALAAMFGSAILHDAGARGVIGMDYSGEALDVARKAATDAALCCADARRLPVRDRSVPVVTSFETLEHLHAPEKFLSELRRVLEPDGVLVLSTPNALHTKPVNGKPENPYHVQEFTPPELDALLRGYFRDVRLIGQTPHPRYRVCPYWVLPEHHPRDWATRARIVAWKLQRRLPQAMRERLSQLLQKRSFYPGERDFVFTEEALATGHVLVAICRP
jgi:SAM-dependent methyltransferase